MHKRLSESAKQQQHYETAFTHWMEKVLEEPVVCGGAPDEHDGLLPHLVLFLVHLTLTRQK